MKYKNILLVIIIGVLSINLVFANSAMSKRYMISGDLIISPELESACSQGTGNWDDGTIIEEEDSGDTSMFFESVDNIFDKLFFSADPAVPVPTTCRVEIYSPNGTLVKKVLNLNAQAIKDGLKRGVVTPSINNHPSAEKLDFTVKIIATRPNGTDQTMLVTTVSVPNINNGLKIVADTVSATISEDTSALNAGASPVLMLTKSGSNYYTTWRRIAGNNILPNSINAKKLYTISGENLTDKNNWVLSLNNQNGLMEWTLVGAQNIALHSINSQHLSESVIQEIDSKVGKSIHITDKNANTNEVIETVDGYTIPPSERDSKYFKIPITDSNGVTTTYLLPVFILESENPTLDIPQSRITLGVVGSTTVNATIIDIKTNTIHKAVANNDAGYITVTDPIIYTLNGIQKASVNVTCNSYIPVSTLPRVTLSGNSIRNNTVIQDYFDVNCTADPNGSITITTTGSDVIYNQTRTIDATGNNININSVDWTQTGSGISLSGEQVVGGNSFRVSVTCGTQEVSSEVTVSATKLVGGTVSDSIQIHCIPQSPGGGGGGACFKEGTKIYTTKGWKNIETIKSGDKVYSYSDDGKLIETNVKALLIHNELRKGDDSVKLELSNNKTLFVTTNHAFYSPDDLDYKALRNFNIGDNLLYFNELTNTFENVKITKITILPPFNTSYNLAIDSPNNYLAEGIVVHNDRKHWNPLVNPPTGDVGV